SLVRGNGVARAGGGADVVAGGAVDGDAVAAVGKSKGAAGPRRTGVQDIDADEVAGERVAGSHAVLRLNENAVILVARDDVVADDVVRCGQPEVVTIHGVDEDAVRLVAQGGVAG